MHKLEVWVGDQIGPTIDKAAAKANKLAEPVHFEFNGVEVVVAADSDVNLLMRDWDRAIRGYIGDKPTIGPYPSSELSAAELEHDQEIAQSNAELAELQQAERNSQIEQASDDLYAALADLGPLELLDEAAWAVFVSRNQDPYGARCVRYAEQWGRLMQGHIAKGEGFEQFAYDTSRLADDDGITGFMQSAAMSVLIQCWKYGESLAAWNRTKYSRRFND